MAGTWSRKKGAGGPTGKPTPRMLEFFDALRAAHGDEDQALEASGVSRQVYRRKWMPQPRFYEQLEAIKNELLDEDLGDPWPRELSKKQRAFLAAYAETGIVGGPKGAASAATCSESAVWRWLADPAEQVFQDAFEVADEIAGMGLQDVARARARQTKVWLQDGTGSKREVIDPASGTLLIFLLKARFPETYRERYEHEVTGDLSTRKEIQLVGDDGKPVDIASVLARLQTDTETP